MAQDKNHWIALYLTGKYPGLFRTPDKLLFLDHLQAINLKAFSDDRIKMFGMFGQIDECEFYYSFLNKVLRDFPEAYNDFLNKLDIPKEIFEKVENKFSYADLLIEFEKLELITKAQEKGKALEDFLKNFFSSIEGLEIMEIKKQAKDEQIDLIIKNNVNRPFWLNLGSPIFLGEAKNWNNNTNAETINTLKGKLDGHKNFSKIGFVVAINGFTDVVEQTQLRAGGGEKIVFTITGEEIRNLLKSKQDPVLWLENKITNAFV